MRKIIICLCLSSLVLLNINANEEMGLTNSQKYNMERKGALIPFLVNTFIGFGIGSLAQEDYIGAAIVSGLEIGGIALLVTGILNARKLENKIEAALSNMKVRTLDLALMGIGITSIITGKIVSMIIPFMHANKYNKDLKLKYNVAFEPIYNYDLALNSHDIGLKIMY